MFDMTFREFLKVVIIASVGGFIIMLAAIATTVALVATIGGIVLWLS